MKTPVRALALPGLVALAACSNDSPLGPSAEPRTRPLAEENTAMGASRIGFLTRNLYVGADLDVVIAALVSPDPQDDLPALLGAIQTLQETDFARRAEGFADEIARSQPHFVGLQEASTIDVDLTPLSIPITIQLDFLPTLLAELARRKLDYVVAAKVKNLEAMPIPGVSLTDYDAILVDASRVEVSSKVEATFANNIGPVAPGVVLKSGWVAVAATVGGRALTVASTHLASGGSAGLDQLRAAQALEIVTTLGSTFPAVIMGDLNGIPGSPMYQVVTGAGFADVWHELRPGVIGNTCCHLPDLSNPVEAFHQRIDYVVTRGLSHPDGKLLGKVTRIGDRSSSLLAGPLHPIWPSDHAGLLAELLLPPASGLAER